MVDWMIFTSVNHPEGNKPTFFTVCCHRVRRSFQDQSIPFWNQVLHGHQLTEIVMCARLSEAKIQRRIDERWAAFRCAAQIRLYVYGIVECEWQVLVKWKRNCILKDRQRTILVESAAIWPCKIHTRHLSWTSATTYSGLNGASNEPSSLKYLWCCL